MFFTDEKLQKIGIKTSPLCSFYKIHDDSIEHMLFLCPEIQSFWDSVHDWLALIGYSWLHHISETYYIWRFRKY